MVLGYAPSFWLGLLVAGIALGGIYALFSSGLTMIFGAAQVMNFAQGELFMIGGYLLWFFTGTAGIPFGLSLPLVAVVMAGVGVLLGSTLLARAVRSARAQEISLVLTLGLSVVLRELAQAWFGNVPKTPSYAMAGPHVSIGGISIQSLRFLSLALAIVLLTGLWWFMSRTRIGLAVRAMPQNRDLARTVGIPARRVTVLAIALGSALSGIAGASIAPYYGVFPNMGAAFLFTGFAILFIGGMTNVAGTLVASLAVGVVTSVAGGVVSATAASIAPLAVMAVATLLRPDGVFGTRSRLT
jgi:branched-chain amino acid transport system permease protein